MIDYIPGVVAFVAAFLAVVGGDKTDQSKRGLRRVTRVGWLVISLAVLAFGSGIAITRHTHQALEVQERQRKVVRSVADTEIRLALHTLTGWFFMLVGDDGLDARFALVPPHILDMQRVRAAQEIDIRKPLEIFSPATSWAELLESSATRGSQQLTQALQIYAPYLDPETLALLSELRTSDFLVLRLRGLSDYVSMNKNVTTLGFHFVDPLGMLDHMDTGYERFWEIVARLDKVLELDQNKLERRPAP
jgi:hypothetical protein